MTSEPAPPTRLGRLLRSRGFAIVAIAVAAALVIGAGVVSVIKFWPKSVDTENIAESAPVAFGTAIIPLSAPSLTRGDALRLRIEVNAPDPVSTIELWDGDKLYYTVSDPTEDVQLDYVPLLAGAHLLTARSAIGSGATSISAPLSVAVTDRPPAEWTIGPNPEPGFEGTVNSVTIESSPGDTFQIIGDRLGVDWSKLILLSPDKDSGTPDGAPGPDDPLPPGTPILSPVITHAIALAVQDFGPILPHIDIPTLTTSVADCTATITIEQTDKKWAVYASTPLRPGYVRVGDVSPSTPLSFATLPLGPTMFVAYRVGTTPQQLGLENIPTLPVQAVIPDDCLSRGWKGDARIVNGMLMTDADFEQAYAYISIDAKPYIRVPGGVESTLPNTRINDIRQWLTNIKYDQANVQVWRSVDGDSFKVAEGSFCLRDVPGATGSDGSNAGLGLCSPPPPPEETGSTGGPLVTSLDVFAEGEPTNTGPFGTPDPTAVLQQQLDQAADAVAYADDPLISQKVSLKSDKTVTLKANVTGIGQAGYIKFQFSYFPLSSTSSIEPPGVFKVVQQKLTSNSDGTRSATISIHPWLWKDSKPDLENSSEFQLDGDKLDLDDELAYAIAQQRLAEGHGLVNEIYVRALPVEQLVYGFRAGGAGSRSVLVSMPELTSDFTVDDATIVLKPGLDTKAPDGAYQGRCAKVDKYPDTPAQWLGDPDPDYGNRWNNYKMAYALFPDAGAVYCMDPNIIAIREARAQAEADDCGLGCFLMGVGIGFVLGFAAGGPVGGLIGALAGGAMAAAVGAQFKEALKALQQFWDTLAAIYNLAYQTVLDIAAAINPICIQAKAIEAAYASLSETEQSNKVSSVCKSVTKVVTSAAITYTTGLPPSLPPSSALVELGQGKLQGLMVAGMDYALGQVGLSCDDVAVEGGGASDLVDLADDHLGNAQSHSALETARRPDGGYGLCDGVANLVTKEVRNQVEGFYTKTMGDMMGLWLPAGMVMTPVNDIPPTLVIKGTEGLGDSDKVKAGDTCPAVVNYTVNLATDIPNVADDPNGYGGHHAVLRSIQFRPITTQLKATGVFGFATGWRAEVPVPVVPTNYQWTGNDGLFLQKIDTDPDPSRPYLEATVDSPCFPATLSLTAAKYYAGDDNWGAFQTDARPIRYYA